MTRLLLLGNCLGDRDENINRQKPDTILVVCGEVLEKRNHLFNDNRWRHGLDEFREVVCCLSADHRSIIVHKLAVMLPEGLLRWGCSARVRSLVETSRGNLGGEPVGFRQAEDEGNEGVLNLLLRQLLADLVQRLNGLLLLAMYCH